MCHKRSRGFTLIELLVVVSIIALLIALLLPSLGAAKQTSRQVKCMVNLRQQGVAGHVYSQANKGHLPAYLGDFAPPANVDPNTKYLYRTWCVNDEYLKALGYSLDKVSALSQAGIPVRTSPLVCPEAPDMVMVSFEVGTRYMYLNYGWTSAIGGRYSGGRQRRMDEFKRPASLLWSVDGIASFIYAYDTAFRVDYRHRDGASLVFVDGHTQRRPQWLPNDPYLWENSN